MFSSLALTLKGHHIRVKAKLLLGMYILLLTVRVPPTVFVGPLDPRPVLRGLDLLRSQSTDFTSCSWCPQEEHIITTDYVTCLGDHCTSPSPPFPTFDARSLSTHGLSCAQCLRALGGSIPCTKFRLNRVTKFRMNRVNAVHSE